MGIFNTGTFYLLGTYTSIGVTEILAEIAQCINNNGFSLFNVMLQWLANCIIIELIFYNLKLDAV